MVIINQLTKQRVAVTACKWALYRISNGGTRSVNESVLSTEAVIVNEAAKEEKKIDSCATFVIRTRALQSSLSAGSSKSQFLHLNRPHSATPYITPMLSSEYIADPRTTSESTLNTQVEPFNIYSQPIQ
eukprot:TRINITY_DN4706_c0_g1_i1.p2 TRINITY_DN4706_c0_g1~~TRINITY_DN4706_c0_g1_i1.p2  ORF type:complete len:129 (-),score=19.89 TRINITY_DN4706_c0_g1_i1:17-403(-)